MGQTSIPCSDATKGQVESQKRGGETYDQLLQKMVEQYDPGQSSN